MELYYFYPTTNIQSISILAEVCVATNMNSTMPILVKLSTSVRHDKNSLTSTTTTAMMMTTRQRCCYHHFESFIKFSESLVMFWNFSLIALINITVKTKKNIKKQSEKARIYKNNIKSKYFFPFFLLARLFAILAY